MIIKHKVLKVTKDKILLVCGSEVNGDHYCSNWDAVTCIKCKSKSNIRKK
jgi:hypothetical protein